MEEEEISMLTMEKVSKLVLGDQESLLRRNDI